MSWTPSPTRATPGSSGRSRPRSSPRKAGYSRPHTIHCGPGGIFLFALGGANGNDGPGGIALLDHDTFDVIGAWELDRGDQFFGYDGWWHLNHDTVITSEWAHPVDGRERPQPRGPAGPPVRPPPELLVACPSAS